MHKDTDGCSLCSWLQLCAAAAHGKDAAGRTKPPTLSQLLSPSADDFLYVQTAEHAEQSANLDVQQCLVVYSSVEELSSDLCVHQSECFSGRGRTTAESRPANSLEKAD